MKVNVGKGIILDVDVDRFNGEVMGHVVYIGLRNILMDSHASATAESGKDPYAIVEKKLESMYAGEIKAAGERTGDPVARDMLAQATAIVKAAVVAKGRKLKDVDLPKLAKDYVSKHEAELREKAESRVAESKAAAAEIGLDDLGL